ncbi:MAG: hypothetical protein V4760_17520 [Bdellovibrionota bacterium]
MRHKDNTMAFKSTLTRFLLATTVAFTLSACGDKKGGPPDDEGGELSQKASACDSGTFTECAREVLASTGLLEIEKEELSGCKFDSARSRGTPVDQFEVAKQAVKRTCE